MNNNNLFLDDSLQEGEALIKDEPKGTLRTALSRNSSLHSLQSLEFDDGSGETDALVKKNSHHSTSDLLKLARDVASLDDDDDVSVDEFSEEVDESKPLAEETSTPVVQPAIEPETRPVTRRTRSRSFTVSTALQVFHALSFFASIYVLMMVGFVVTVPFPTKLIWEAARPAVWGMEALAGLELGLVAVQGRVPLSKLAEGVVHRLVRIVSVACLLPQIAAISRADDWTVVPTTLLAWSIMDVTRYQLNWLGGSKRWYKLLPLVALPLASSAQARGAWMLLDASTVVAETGTIAAFTTWFTLGSPQVVMIWVTCLLVHGIVGPAIFYPRAVRQARPYL